MSLKQVAVPEEPVDLPGDIAALIAEAEARMDAFIEATTAAPIRAFVPSDGAQVFAVLQHIVDHRLAPGSRFCEWGSGFGLATLLAASLGLEATGMELESDLVRASRELALDFGLEAELVEGDYFPPNFDVYRDEIGETVQLLTSPRENPLYDEIGLDPVDIDILFIYPWPGEAQMIEELFDRIAAEGALLILYHGPEDIVVWRRVEDD